ncbi:hypothetical protein DENSPDRAFT_885855 [Dentipellis sp. KUC8613]|nr:hypothetical protein DENSPDRAFT_885855 [Dentipellis sp. KUC8613]
MITEPFKKHRLLSTTRSTNLSHGLASRNPIPSRSMINRMGNSFTSQKMRASKLQTLTFASSIFTTTCTYILSVLCPSHNQLPTLDDRRKCSALVTTSPFPRIAALLRVNSPQQLSILSLATQAHTPFATLFPSGPTPFANLHPREHLEDALAVQLLQWHTQRPSQRHTIDPDAAPHPALTSHAAHPVPPARCARRRLHAAAVHCGHGVTDILADR